MINLARPRESELEKQLAALGYGAPKRRGRPPGKTNGSGNGAALRKARKGKVKAKYRDPKTNETWSGPRPDGELAQEQAGRRREDREVPGLTRFFDCTELRPASKTRGVFVMGSGHRLMPVPPHL